MAAQGQGRMAVRARRAGALKSRPQSEDEGQGRNDRGLILTPLANDPKLSPCLTNARFRLSLEAVCRSPQKPPFLRHRRTLRSSTGWMESNVWCRRLTAAMMRSGSAVQTKDLG